MVLKNARTVLAVMLVLTTVSMLLIDPTIRSTFARHSDDRDLVSSNDGGDDAMEVWAEPELINDDGPVEFIIGIKNVPQSYEKLAELLTKHGAKILDTISMRGQITAVLATVPSKVEASLLITEINTAELSRYIEPNARFKVFRFEPNDPAWKPDFPYHQWGPKKINANWAWNITMGDLSVLIAVVDTGIDYNHEDLAANYVPYGYDWVNNDNDPMDDFGHGTHCTGILAAETNNAKGVAGLAQVRIMAEKVGDHEGVAKLTDIADGIIHAVDCNAKIISMSFGHYFRSETVYEAVKYAYDCGVLLVAAAGNENWSGRLYPAAFKEVMAVTATDQQDKLWVNGTYGSNYGNWVELAAPGKDIYSTYWYSNWNNSYEPKSGTSMACPHVAGVAALVWSRYPNMTRDQVRIHLRKTANKTYVGDSGFSPHYGYGRVDANASVSQPPPNHDVLILDWERPPYVEVGKPAIIKPNILNYGTSQETGIQVNLYVNGSVKDSQYISSLASGASTTINLSWTPTAEGVYNVTAHVVPVSGEKIDARKDNAVSANITTEVGVLRVPKYFPTIQEAVDASNPEDTIRVANGNYCEVVNVYKDGLNLIGENKTATVINCMKHIGTWGFVVRGVDNIHISSFKVQDTYGYYPPDPEDPLLRPSGILLMGSDHSSITNNVIYRNYRGLVITFPCTDNVITNNKIYINDYSLIMDYVPFAPGNNLTGNYITGRIILFFTSRNRIYHNNFISYQLERNCSSDQWQGRWNITGSYWSDYSGADDGSNNRTAGDGVGDTNLPHQGVDSNPLMAPWLPGDITHDGKVNYQDQLRLARAWGKTSGDPDWYPWHAHADLNEDGIVDGKDQQILNENYGKTWKDYWDIS